MGMIMQHAAAREPNLAAIADYPPIPRIIFRQNRRKSISPTQQVCTGEMQAPQGCFTTAPPFITNTGFSSVVTSASGSPLTAIMSP